MLRASNQRNNASSKSSFNKSAAISQTYKLSYYADQDLSTKRIELETYSVLLEKNNNDILFNQLRKMFFSNVDKDVYSIEINEIKKKVDEFLQSTKTNLDFELKNSDHFFKCSLILVDNFLLFNLVDLSFLNKFSQIDFDKIFSQITATIWLTDEKGVIKGINQQWDRNAEYFEELEKQRGTFRKAIYSNELIGKNFSDFLVGKKSKLFYSFIKLLLKFFPKLSHEFWANNPCELECKEKELLHMVYAKQRLNISNKIFHVHLAINYTPFTDELFNYYQLQKKQILFNKFLKIPFKELISKSFENHHIFFLSRFRDESYYMRYLQLQEIFLRNYRIKELIVFNDNTLPTLTLNLPKLNNLNYNNKLISSNYISSLEEYSSNSDMNFVNRMLESKHNHKDFNNRVDFADFYKKYKSSISRVSVSEIETNVFALKGINSNVFKQLEFNFKLFPLSTSLSLSLIRNNEIMLLAITYSNLINKSERILNQQAIMLENLSYPNLKNTIYYGLTHGINKKTLNVFRSSISDKVNVHLINNELLTLNVVLSVSEFPISKILLNSQNYSMSKVEKVVLSNVANKHLTNSFFELIAEIKTSNHLNTLYLFEKALFNDSLISPKFIRSNYSYLNHYEDISDYKCMSIELFDNQKVCYTSNQNYLYNLVAMSIPKDEKITTSIIQTSWNNKRLMPILAYNKIHVDRISIKVEVDSKSKTINKIAQNGVTNPNESIISTLNYKISNFKNDVFLNRNYIFRLLILLRAVKKSEAKSYKNKNFLKSLFSIIFRISAFFTFIKAKCQ